MSEALTDEVLYGAAFVGAVAGAVCGFTVDQTVDGLVAGGLVSAVAAAIGAEYYKPGPEAPRVAVGMIPPAGWLGGVAAAVWVEAGLIGALAACAIGYVGGLLLICLLPLLMALSDERQMRRAALTLDHSPSSGRRAGTPAVETRRVSVRVSRDRIDPEAAADLAFRQLLAAQIRRDALITTATTMSRAIYVQSNHALALATALHFFEQEELKSRLGEAQLMARLNIGQWLQDGLIEVPEARQFEDRLYRMYKP